MEYDKLTADKINSDCYLIDYKKIVLTTVFLTPKPSTAMSKKSSFTKVGVLTIPDLHRVLNVSIPVIRRWLDNGLLKGAYSYPGSNFRKIPAPNVIEFLRSHNMVVPAELIELADKYNRHFVTERKR